MQNDVINSNLRSGTTCFGAACLRQYRITVKVGGHSSTTYYQFDVTATSKEQAEKVAREVDFGVYSPLAGITEVACMGGVPYRRVETPDLCKGCGERAVADKTASDVWKGKRVLCESCYDNYRYLSLKTEKLQEIIDNA